MQEGGERRERRGTLLVVVMAVVAIVVSALGVVLVEPEVAAEPGVTPVSLDLEFSAYPPGGSVTYRVTRTLFGSGAVEVTDVPLTDGSSTSLSMIEGDQVSVSRLGSPSLYRVGRVLLHGRWVLRARRDLRDVTLRR